MRARLERRALIRALDRVASADVASDSAAIAGYALLSAVDDSFRVTLWDQAFTTASVIPAAVRSIGSMAVSHRRMVEVLRRMSADEVTLFVRRDGLHLDGGDDQATLKTRPATEFPDEDLSQGACDARLAARDFSNVFTRVLWAAHEQVAHPALSSASLYLGDRSAEARASNGLTFATARVAATCARRLAVTVSSRVARKLASLEAVSDVEIAVVGTTICVRADEFALRTRAVGDGAVHNRSVQGEPLGRASFEREALVRAIAFVRSIEGREHAPLTIEFADGSAVLSLGTEDDRVTSNLPTEYEGPKLRAVVGAELLARAAETAAGDRLTISILEAGIDLRSEDPIRHSQTSSYLAGMW